MQSKQTQKIVQFAKDNPCITRSRIAEHYGLSRERVRQILARANVNTRHTIDKRRFCHRCGNEITDKHKHLCYDCRNIPIKCDDCGNIIPRHFHQVAHPTMQHRFAFCNATCRGHYMGTHFGFKKHHPSYKHGHTKYDSLFLADFRTLLFLHYTLKKIAKELKISYSAVIYIRYTLLPRQQIKLEDKKE